jgi:hypothetical protein
MRKIPLRELANGGFDARDARWIFDGFGGLSSIWISEVG